MGGLFLYLILGGAVSFYRCFFNLRNEGVLSGAKSGDLSGGGKKGSWNGFTGIVMFWWGEGDFRR